MAIHKRKKSPPKRHIVQIKLPAAATGSRGQRSGADTLVMNNVWASIEPLAGTELELARQKYAAVTHRVCLFGDPNNPLTTKHYILFGSRKLQIGFTGNGEETGYEYQLLCGETA